MNPSVIYFVLLGFAVIYFVLSIVYLITPVGQITINNSRRLNNYESVCYLLRVTWLSRYLLRVMNYLSNNARRANNN